MNVINILKNSPDKSPTPKIEVFPKKGKFAIFINSAAKSFEIASQVYRILVIGNLGKKSFPLIFNPITPLILVLSGAILQISNVFQSLIQLLK